MEMTTIAVSKDVRRQICEFGCMGESCSDVLVRLIKSARERQLHDLLMNEEGCVPIEDAIREARRKWPR